MIMMQTMKNFSYKFYSTQNPLDHVLQDKHGNKCLICHYCEQPARLSELRIRGGKKKCQVCFDKNIGSGCGEPVYFSTK